MNVFTKKNLVALAIVFGAMIFGMVLAGGLGLTPKGQTSPEPSPVAERFRSAELCRSGGTGVACGGNH